MRRAGHMTLADSGGRPLRARATSSRGSRRRCATPARTRRGRRVDDLAGVDEFHSRGREATLELAELLPPAIDTELLDIGSGLGGPARFLAATRGYRVVGIDLTPEYVDVADELTRRCGLADRARFLTADAARPAVRRTPASPPPTPSTWR